MKTEELAEILAQQRARRKALAKPQPPSAPRVNRFVGLAILAVFVAASALYLRAMYESAKSLDASATPEATLFSSGVAIASPAPSPFASSFTARICTNVPNGFLGVRANSGTGAVVAWLAEGQQVAVAAQDGAIVSATFNDGSVWDRLTLPSGWVNAVYLCGLEKTR